MRSLIIYLLTSVAAVCALLWGSRFVGDWGLPLLFLSFIVDLVLLFMAWRMVLLLILSAGKDADTYKYAGWFGARDIVAPTLISWLLFLAAFNSDPEHPGATVVFVGVAALLSVAWVAGLAVIIMIVADKKRQDAWLEELLRNRKAEESK